MIHFLNLTKSMTVNDEIYFPYTFKHFLYFYSFIFVEKI